ncbi:hypothetical protein LEP1GSC125_0312 [Leptospira mayottensis 200901122]|uniref:Uncharacterized protein n=1 Tax=Leptospira mayottensis 200901122 TaxID=1193010 RepID=A0AA87MM43_9LEPT|nr:hypothetical protein LEP1GSC125_0312 [Leptospira mayottensis 200901122]
MSISQIYFYTLRVQAVLRPVLSLRWGKLFRILPVSGKSFLFS